MTLIQMKETIKNLYGEASFEYGYFCKCFAKRPEEYTRKIYFDLVKKKAVSSH